MQNVVPTVSDVISELHARYGESQDFSNLFSIYLQYEDDLTDEVSYSILKRFVQSSKNYNPYKQLSDIIQEEMEKLKEITKNNSEIRYNDINKTLMNTSSVALFNEQIQKLHIMIFIVLFLDKILIGILIHYFIRNLKVVKILCKSFLKT